MEKKINQWACYNRIWSWSPMPCEKHGPRASVTTKTSAFGLGFCLLSPSGHVFHTARETMIKSYNMTQSLSYQTTYRIIAFVSPSIIINSGINLGNQWTTLRFDSNGRNWCFRFGHENKMTYEYILSIIQCVSWKKSLQKIKQENLLYLRHPLDRINVKGN